MAEKPRRTARIERARNEPRRDALHKAVRLAGVRPLARLNLYSDLLRSAGVESSPSAKGRIRRCGHRASPPLADAIFWWGRLEGGSKGGGAAGRDVKEGQGGRTGAMRLTG